MNMSGQIVFTLSDRSDHFGLLSGPGRW